jgi:hypothetical protein
MSNGPWSTKVAALDEHTVLMLNRDVVDQETWDEDVIRDRSARMFEYALKIWPRPSGGAGGTVAQSDPVALPSQKAGGAAEPAPGERRVQPGVELDLDFSMRASSKYLIEDLVQEFAMDEALFRRVHHYGPDRYPHHKLLKEHLRYCDRAPRFSAEGTNAGTARRLAVCLSRLRQGSSWDDAIRDACIRFPVAG